MGSLALMGVYLLLAFLKSDTSNWNLVFGTLTGIIEVGIDLLLLSITHTIVRSRLNKLTGILFFSFCFLLIGDVVYNFEINVLNLTNLRGTALEMSYNGSYMFFLLTAAIFFFINAYLSNPKHRLIPAVFSGLIAVGFLLIFVPKMLAEGLPWWSFGCHFVCMLSKGLIVGYAILFLVFGSNTGLRLISAGMLTIFSYSIIMEYIEIFGTLTQGLATEGFWIFGQLIIYLGLKSFYKNGIRGDQDAKITTWDFQSLDSRLLIYGFLLSISALLSWHSIHLIWLKSSGLPTAGLIFGWILMMLIILSAFTIYLRTFIIEPLHQLYKNVSSANSSNNFSVSSISSSEITEFRQLSQSTLDIFKNLKTEKEKNEQMSRIATQMSHDIRSPLAALRMLTSQVDYLPEDSRQMINSVAARIHLIADTLIKSQSNEKKDSRYFINKSCLAYSVVESIISEKRLILPKNVTLDLIVLDYIHGFWINLHEETLGRAISNLLNNSIDSFLDNNRIGNCRITLTLSKAGNSAIRLTIQDNAGGIPPEVEIKIREGMKTTTKEHGLGPGLTHAKNALEACSGRFELLTQFGFGTVINLIIPVIQSPPWLADSLSLENIDSIVVIDDDPSIHEVWKARLQNVMDIIHFKSTTEALEYLPTLSSKSLFLVDHEFRKTSENGLNFIESSLLGKKAYLVTSHYLEDEIGCAAQAAHIKVIPKFLAPFIRIQAAMHTTCELR